MNRYFYKLTFFALIVYSLFYVQLYAKSKNREIILKFKPSSNVSLKNAHKLQRVHPSFAQHGEIEVLPIAKLNIRNRQIMYIAQRIGIDRISKLQVPENANAHKLLSDLKNHPLVEYAAFNHSFQLHNLPDDPRITEQWLIEKIQLDQAWNITYGNRDILIAIIDTGIDYFHADLIDNLWVNPGEDLNQNGLVDSTDFNGIDDDQNGYIDDIRGWDFTDAPHFPDGGDYLEPDNDPFDEHGHGTAVAGIIGATTNNGIGIAGVAPGCSMMNLRAGTSQGLLEEDDVASAIIYAVDNGAQIINMSFGDVASTQMLKDVIQFAYESGVTLIASAGNSASTEVHYPSGFSQVISVGAVNSNDNLAGFSNYGALIDLVAPGVSLLTTNRGNRYQDFSGTSASAPVVSGVAGLILSQQPLMTNQNVRNILVTSTDDLGEADWDQYHGSGRLNAFKAVQVDNILQATISEPDLDQGFFGDRIDVIGTASGALLEQYELSFGIGNNPQQWEFINHQSARQVLNDTLGVWEITNLPDSSYTLRLRVFDKSGKANEHRTRIFIDRTPPQLLSLKKTRMIDKYRHSQLIEFVTDDVTSAAICYRKNNSDEPFKQIDLNYKVRTHRYNFTEQGDFEFYIKHQNSAGLMTEADSAGNFYHLQLMEQDIEVSRFSELDYDLPSLYLLNKIVDFDRDSHPEFIACPLYTSGAFGNLHLFEFENGQFNAHELISKILIPRDIGDSDQDSLMEILAGAGPNSFILESTQENTFPQQIVWADSNNFWASRFADLDNDGKVEIIGRRENTFFVYENNGDNEYQKVQALPNPTDGSNITGVPHTAIGDFDGDGKMEILIGDYDGDIYIYECIKDNVYQHTWQDSLPLMDAINFITGGDFDGDGIDEFAAGCHSSPNLDLEHEYDGRYWIFRIYDSVDDNDYRVTWEQAFFGFADPADFASGISAGDIDSDNRDELLINIFPDFYVVDYQELSSQYKTVAHLKPSETQTNLIGDFNGDGLNEFFLNNGQKTVAFQDRSVSPVAGPPYPAGFDAYPLDETSVFLGWLPVKDADAYHIYRGDSFNQWHSIELITATRFTDTTVNENNIFYYAVATIDTSNIPVEGKMTATIAVRPGQQPFLENADFILSNQLRLRFSEPMDESISEVSNYDFLEAFDKPKSAVSSNLGKEVLLTLSQEQVSPGNYQIQVTNVRDKDRTPIDTTRNVLWFQVPVQKPLFYLQNAELDEEGAIVLNFNLPVDPVLAGDKMNYLFQPELEIEQVGVDQNNLNQVRLIIEKHQPVGALGVSYVITVENLTSAGGTPISTDGNQASLVFHRTDLSQVFVYPNPCRVGNAQQGITFANLTRWAQITILTLSGRQIRTLEENDGNGGVIWDLKNEKGQTVGAGIYIYRVENEQERKWGKLAVIR